MIRNRYLSKWTLAWAFALSIATSAWTAPVDVATKRAAALGDGVAAFYPARSVAENRPSFALAEEPPEQGGVSSAWRVQPRFFEDEGRSGAIIELPPGTDVYGTGEATGPLRRNGASIELWNTDNYGYRKADGKRLYQSHPWFLAVRPDGSSFGVIFDSTWRAEIEATEESVRYVSDGPFFRVIVIDRPSPQAVLETLADLTGHMPLPPLWALGFQQCKYSYETDARVREIADTFRRKRIPCDVIWMDIDYMRGYRIFTFDPERFPDPAATNDYLHGKGFKSIWMIDPGVKKDPGYSVYDSGTTRDVWIKTKSGEPFVGKVWPGDCVFPDFTMPRTRDWWSGLYRDYLDTGIDGVWNDMNEPSVFDGPDGTAPVDVTHGGGGDLTAARHARYHNVYGMLMVGASRAGILDTRPERRPFILTRSNFLGGQRYAATWTGDNEATWEHLKMSVPMCLNLGLSGQPFCGPDIGGFSGEADPVLYGHWIALGAFYPFSRAHADNAREEGNEPWAFGPEIEEVARTALSRRYRLLPYLYTQMEDASRTGLPVMRPAFFADSADARLRKEQSVFLFGPDLLVVPKWAKNPNLPQGDWRAVHVLSREQEGDGYQPKLLIRPGAIVPIGNAAQSTRELTLDALTLLVALDSDGRAEGALYEDDGDGFGYRDGDFARERFVARRDSDQVWVRLAEVEGKRAVPAREVTVRLVLGGEEREATGDLKAGIRIKL